MIYTIGNIVFAQFSYFSVPVLVQKNNFETIDVVSRRHFRFIRIQTILDCFFSCLIYIRRNNPILFLYFKERHYIIKFFKEKKN